MKRKLHKTMEYLCLEDGDDCVDSMLMIKSFIKNDGKNSSFSKKDIRFLKHKERILRRNK